MVSNCPLDVQFADEISALLKTPTPQQIQDYFENLIATRQCRGLEVRQHAELGKGVYANIALEEGELILKDQMLVGAQHCSNKMDCLVCSFCFRFIGSIELQIGRKLYFQGLGASSNDECHSHLTDIEEDDCIDNHNGLGECSTSNSRNKYSLPMEITESLMDREMLLPHSKNFSLPPIVPCPGKCGEAYYCSKSCADMDWESCHSLLCIGERSTLSRKEALSKFIEHANDTNDIFVLAAKAISFTILRYKKLKGSHIQEEEHEAAAFDLSVLLEAWKPISMGYKRRWWDCIALPADVDPCDEVAFRMQIKEIAWTSLQHLKAALFDEEYAPLFSLDIYGHLIGMFELNNLDLVVASPVEDYFLYIDDLPDSKKREAEALTKQIFEALGDDYSTSCQGTAFFPLQSCMNHSCCPNARAFKGEEDRDGQAAIIALKPIQVGEEVTISYIDEDLPYNERQALLADYGFICECPKCLEEGKERTKTYDSISFHVHGRAGSTMPIQPSEKRLK
ncbi:Histone-lysine N-methyltransferase atxr2 [Dionaea muscipula]